MDKHNFFGLIYGYIYMWVQELYPILWLKY